MKDFAEEIAKATKEATDAVNRLNGYLHKAISAFGKSLGESTLEEIVLLRAELSKDRPSGLGVRGVYECTNVILMAGLAGAVRETIFNLSGRIKLESAMPEITRVILAGPERLNALLRSMSSEELERSVQKAIDEEYNSPITPPCTQPGGEG